MASLSHLNMDQNFMNSLNKLAAEISKSLSKGVLTLLQQEKTQKMHELGQKYLHLGRI